MANKWSISMRLLKDGITISEVIKKTNLRLVEEFTEKGCTLYVNKQREASTPLWASELLEIPDDKYKLRNKNSSALLFVKLDSGRVIVLSFGSGYMSIKDKFIEDNFGLITTLNYIDEKTLLSVDLFTPEVNTTQKRIQKGHYTKVNEFGINQNKEMLKRITGISKNADFGSMMTGADSFSIKCELTKDMIKEKCEEAFSVYNCKTYKTNFGWIDNVRVIRDAKLIKKLRNEVLKVLNSGLINPDSLTFSLVFPSIVDYETLGNIKFTGFRCSEEFTELKLENYIRALNKKNIKRIKYDDFEKHKVCYYNLETDKFSSGWAITKCIVSEIELEGNNYVSFAGKWYLIDSDYYKLVKKQVEMIMSESRRLTDFPEFDGSVDFVIRKNGKKLLSENEYNKRVSHNTKYELMDCEYIHNTEVCDLFSKDKQLIHVKRWSGSSVLSHLFNQGIVSSQAFIGSNEYREEIRLKFKNIVGIEKIFQNNKPDASKFHIHYVIIDGRKCKKNTLPFFSQITLINTHDIISKQMNFNMHLWWIDEK